ncbi:glycogen debranching protein GlgX [Tatumella citrea]|uniref:Glycogen debranching enzyme GlgX n=1 Tax=Tatumella citrea TaxID=53336 RepID=A0A1Y0LMA5_TATCI|nr:glycogen debranching protein GlgX [Tatumella citrea]ARU94772.1 glycogen debranching enzyme GlgX [Tatumella citrea]ARU98810.1 glycogen debranching enzyme GlgX [Tatumella citrea]
MSVLLPGKPYPFGASLQENGVNFCVFSATAEKIELCLFDSKNNEQRLEMPARTGNLWHGFLPMAKVGQRYGYRAYGTFDPARGLRFNAQKLLIDPSARALEGSLNDDPHLNGGIHHPEPVDTAYRIPKSVVTDEHFDWENDALLMTPWGQTIIYEAHVRGLSMLHPEIPEDIRGTYLALAHPAMLAHFKKLGITALELLPVAQHSDEPRLQHMGLHNYWGYNLLAAWSPEPLYATHCQGSSAAKELKTAIKALHQAGIEVILDVVFNHTAELDIDGPTLSQRGLDNPGWYWLNADGTDNNVTGCGNAMRLTDNDIIGWVLSCLRYWVEQFHIDGFRFDLAPLLGRTPEFRSDSPMLQAIISDPLLSRCKLIAEPWDIGPGGYQLGNFPAPFAEWNDQWRDGMRKFWLHGTLPVGDFAGKVSASASLFKHAGRLPNATINMITAHDGFTLQDLVSFNQKHNHANGENNRDGHDDNYSQNHGTEGPEASDSVLSQRRLSQRALLATLLLSQGTPMLLAGDEFGHSQQGNNNAYCQDNRLSWLNWQQADLALTDYVSSLITLRKKIPAITLNRWWEEGSGDVAWFNNHGQPMTTEQWLQPGLQCLQICLSGRWLMVVNASLNDVDMTLPTGSWHAVAPFDNPLRTLADGLSWRSMAKTVCVFTRDVPITPGRIQP